MNSTPSTFDPNQFMNSTVETAFEVKRTSIPAGDYLGIIDDMVTRVVEAKQGPSRVVLDLNWEIQDEALKASLNLNKVIVRQSVFLDFDAAGKLASGVNQNVQLGQVRAAVSQNTPGQAWGPRMLKGAGPARLKVSQRPDDKNPTIIYNDVDRVTSMTANA